MSIPSRRHSTLGAIIYKQHFFIGYFAKTHPCKWIFSIPMNDYEGFRNWCINPKTLILLILFSTHGSWFVYLILLSCHFTVLLALEPHSIILFTYFVKIYLAPLVCVALKGTTNLLSILKSLHRFTQNQMTITVRLLVYLAIESHNSDKQSCWWMCWGRVKQSMWNYPGDYQCK